MKIHPIKNFAAGFSATLGLLLVILTFAPTAAAQPVALQIQFRPSLFITGAVGSVHSIQYTTNLSPPDWTVLALIQLTNNPHLHLETTAPTGERRFYRSEAIAPASYEDLQFLPDDEYQFFLAAMGIPEMVPINPGTFIMGSPPTETGRGGDEGPQTLVTITRGFYLGKYEVTQAQYAKVTSNNPASFPSNPNFPMEMVSWNDATLFCNRLNQREAAAGRLPAGWIYRLPTEAEWEYACRAGRTTRYSFGDDPNGTQLSQYAWYGEVDTGRTRPVGTKLPNPWGLYDMHGNVWELCRDALGYTGGSVTNPVGTGSGRMTRGGSWHSLNPRCRSATRNPYLATSREPWVGFRIALAPTSP